MAMAGRASEQINFGRVTSGAADDLRRTTQIIYQMVQVYGMNSRVGQVSFPSDNSGGYPQDKLYSEATAEMMDEEVREIVAEAYQRTLDLMESKKEQVKLVAELLLKQETISHTDISKLIGERPYSAGKEYDQFVAHMKERPMSTPGQKNVGDSENDESPPSPPEDGSSLKSSDDTIKEADSDEAQRSRKNDKSSTSNMVEEMKQMLSRSTTVA